MSRTRTQSDESDHEQLVRGYSGRLLTGLSVGYLLIQLGRNVLPPLLPAIRTNLDLTSFQAGSALTILTVAYALSMYPGGRLSDALTRKTVLVSSLIITTLGSGLILLANGYQLFVIGVATFGLGAGLYWISLRALLTDLFSARRGQAFGIQDAVGFIGPIAAAGVAILVLAYATWRTVFPALILIFTVLLAMAHRWVRSDYALSGVEMNLRSTGERVLGDTHVLSLLLSYSCIVFAMQSVIGFLPTYLQVSKDFSPTLASVGFAVLFAGATSSMPLAGYLGDRFHHAPVAVGGLVVCLIGLAMLLFADASMWVGLGAFLFGVGIWVFPPVIQAHLMTRFPTESMGGDFGAFKTVYSGIGSFGPAYVGFVADVTSYQTGFLSLVVPLSAALILMFVTP